MYICECCGNEHDGDYGSGRFCSKSCANTRKHTEETKEKLKNVPSHKKLQEIEIIKICPKCNILFTLKRKINKNGNEIIHKKEKKFCSRHCANSHIQTENQNKKRRDRLKFLNKKVICKICDNIFEIKSYSKKQTCSIECQKIYKSLMNQKASQIRQLKYSTEEWSNLCKESYRKGINYVAGGTTKWYSYKNIKVQGTYELRTCIILDNWKECNLIKNWEYTNDRYSYIGVDNKKHTYILDFKIINNDNSFYYIETKGFIRENDELKWKAVRDRNIKLEIWFLKEIEYFESLLENYESSILL